MVPSNPFDFETEWKYWSAIEVLVPAVAAGFWRYGYTPEDGRLTPIAAIIPILEPAPPDAASSVIRTVDAASPPSCDDALAALYLRWGIVE